MNGNDGYSLQPGGNRDAVVTRAFGDTAEKHVDAASNATDFQINLRGISEGADEEAKMNDEDDDEYEADESLGTNHGMVNWGK